MSAAEQGACGGCTRGRRTWIKLTAGLVVLGASAAGCAHATGAPPTGPVTACNVADLTVAALLVTDNVVVGRDAVGVYAMSAVCTHAGCLLPGGPAAISGGLSCPCHGAAFDGAGNVTHGPAKRALQHYAVAIEADGRLTVDGSQPVTPETRTQVP